MEVCQDLALECRRLVPSRDVALEVVDVCGEEHQDGSYDYRHPPLSNHATWQEKSRQDRHDRKDERGQRQRHGHVTPVIYPFREGVQPTPHQRGRKQRRHRPPPARPPRTTCGAPLARALSGDPRRRARKTSATITMAPAASGPIGQSVRTTSLAAEPVKLGMSPSTARIPGAGRADVAALADQASVITTTAQSASQRRKSRCLRSRGSGRVRTQ